MKLKQLTYAALICFSMVYVFVNQKYCKRIEIVNGYVEDFSVNRGNDVIAYLQPTEEHKKGVVLIYNLKGIVVDSLVCNLQFQDTTTSAKFYETGYNYQHSVAYNTSKLKSGIYYINKSIPFIVKEPELKNAITIVFPYGNMHTTFNGGGKSFYGYNSTNSTPATKLSLHRNLVITDYTLYFLNWIDSLYSHNNLNIITDLDLENYSNISNSKLLVICGNSAFWTYKARRNFDKFQGNKGNVLAIATSIMNNEFRYEEKSKTLLFYPNSHEYSQKMLKNPNLNSVGCSYEIYYCPKQLNEPYGGFKIINSNSPIFKNVNSKSIGFNAGLTNSIALINNEFTDAPKADLQSGNFYEKQILAFDYCIYKKCQTIGGIYLMRKKINSGKLIVIGNEQWCDLRNFYNQDIQQITKNCMDFLK